MLYFIASPYFKVLEEVFSMEPQNKGHIGIRSTVPYSGTSEQRTV